MVLSALSTESKIAPIDETQFKQWVTVCKEYLEIVCFLRSQFKLYAKFDQKMLTRVLLALGKVRVRCRRMRYTVEKALKGIEGVLDLQIYMLRFYLGKISCRQAEWYLKQNQLKNKVKVEGLMDIEGESLESLSKKLYSVFAQSYNFIFN